MLKSSERELGTVLFPLAASPSELLSSSTSNPVSMHRNKTNLEFFQSKMLEEVNNEDIELDLEENVAQDYFKQDPEEEPEEDEEMLRKKLHEQKEGNAYLTSFKFSVFLEFLFIHLVFFCCLGPFTVILSPIFGWKVLQNQGFTPSCSPLYVRQCIEFGIVVSFLIVFYLTDTPGLQAIEIYMLLIGVLIRMILISSKYAYQSELFIKLMHTTVLGDEDKFHDLMLTNWRLQTDPMITEELQSAILRLEVDSPLFFFNFLGNISEGLRNKLSRKADKCKFSDLKNLECEKINADMKGDSKAKGVMTPFGSRKAKEKWEKGVEKITMASRIKEKQPEQENATKEHDDVESETIHVKKTFSKSATAISKLFVSYLKPQKLEERYLHGYNLAFDIRKNARGVKHRNLGKTCLLISFIRALLPTFYRLYLIYYKEEDIPLLTEKPYIVVIAFLLNSFFFWANLFILAVAIQDFKTKVWCFKQIGFLICPRKIHEFHTRKLYPTLNIFDPITIKTWSSLRKVMKEYGKKYIMRNNFNITVCMTLYSFVLCTFVLQMLGVLKAYNDPLMLIVFGYESLVFFVIFIGVLSGAAFLNNQYKVHKNLLKKNKNIISDFAKLSHLYVGSEAIKPDNIIYKQGLKVLRKELGNEDFESKLIARAERLMDMIDETIEELEFEETNDPFTVMGIKVDYTFLKSMAIGGVSLLFALGQSFVNK